MPIVPTVTLHYRDEFAQIGNVLFVDGNVGIPVKQAVSDFAVFNPYPTNILEQ